MTTSSSPVANYMERRYQFVNDGAVAINDGWFFSLRDQQATIFANFAAKVQILAADVDPASAVDSDYLDIATDGTTYAFDGSGTTVRALTGPGHYRMLATGALGSGAFAGIDFTT